jgi:hypothetical protein
LSRESLEVQPLRKLILAMLHHGCGNCCSTDVGVSNT